MFYQVDPVREICMKGNNQGKTLGWTQTWVWKKELVFKPITNDDDSLHYVLNWPPSNSWTIAAS